MLKFEIVVERVGYTVDMIDQNSIWICLYFKVYVYIPTGDATIPELDRSTRDKNIRKHVNFPCNRKSNLGQ